MNSTSIETISGKILDLQNPDPKSIFIEDIAWSLSRISRFNGHSISEIPFNVADHSIYVSSLLKNNNETYRIQLLGLLHDASECYTSDISGPLKKIKNIREVIKPIEDNIQKTIYIAIGINPPTINENDTIKLADKKSQKIEAYHCMPSRAINWDLDISISFVELQQFKNSISSVDSYMKFKELFDFLIKKI